MATSKFCKPVQNETFNQYMLDKINMEYFVGVLVEHRQCGVPNDPRLVEKVLTWVKENREVALEIVLRKNGVV